MSRYKKNEECNPCKYKHRGGSNGALWGLGGLALGGLVGGMVGHSMAKSEQPKTVIIHHDHDDEHRHRHYSDRDYHDDRYVNHIARYELKIKDSFADYLDPEKFTSEIQLKVIRWYNHQVKNKLFDEFGMKKHEDYSLATFPDENYLDYVVIKMNFKRPVSDFLKTEEDWDLFDGFLADPDPYGQYPITIDDVDYLVVGYLIQK